VLNTWHSAHASSIIKKEKMLSQRTGRDKRQKMNDDDERVQKGIAHWDKQNNDVPVSNCVLKVRGEIIKVEGL